MRTVEEEGSGWSLFWAESGYAQSILCSALGDGEGCVEALRDSLEALPTYAPAILSLGSVEYQLDRRPEGRHLFLSLLCLPEGTEELTEIIDKAGDFLISTGEHADGLELYRGGTELFPDTAVFHQGVSCCAGHLQLYDEALAAAEAALALEPHNQEVVNDLGWSLHQAGRLEDAKAALEQAVAMDPADRLAAGNLSLCSSVLATRAA